MPAQYVNIAGAQPDFTDLLTNLAENVKYRRAKEAEKATTAETLSMLQATGQIPNMGDVTITDRGPEWQDENARSSYYQALGSRFGAGKDYTQDGGTNSTAVLENDAPAEARAQMERMSQDQLLRAQAEQDYDNQLKAASLQIVDGMPTSTLPPPPPKPSGPQPLGNTTASAQPQPDATQNLHNAMAAFKVAASTMGIPTTQDLPSLLEPIAPKPTDPTATAAQPNPNVRIQAGSSVGNSESHAAKIVRSLKQGELTADVDQYARTTTTNKAELTDEIRTNYNDLMGMAAYQDTLNNIGSNYFGPSGRMNVYKDLATQRQANLERYEKMLSAEGTSEKLEKVGGVKYKQGGVESQSEVGNRHAYGTRISNNLSGGTFSGGGNPTAKSSVWNISRGSWRGADVPVVETSPGSGQFMTSSKVNGLDIREDEAHQAFALETTKPAAFKSYQARLKNKWNAEVKTEQRNGVTVKVWYRDGQEAAIAQWEDGKQRIGEDGKPKGNGAWDLMVYPGQPIGFVGDLTGDNPQAGQASP